MRKYNCNCRIFKLKKMIKPGSGLYGAFDPGNPAYFIRALISA